MTPEQEGIAEKIILVHKEQNGDCNWFTELQKMGAYFSKGADLEEIQQQFDIIKNYLIQDNLIKEVGEYHTNLTPKGYAFKSYKKFNRQKKSEAFPKKHWLLAPVFIGVVLIIIKIIISICSP